MSIQIVPVMILSALLSVASAYAAAPPAAIPSARAHSSLLLDVARAGERLVAVGERGHIVVSDDAGKSWRQVIVPVRSLLTAVYFVDERNGWAVGHDSVVLATRDAGQTWTLQHYQEFDPAAAADVLPEDDGIAADDEMPGADDESGNESPRIVDRTGVPLLDVWFRDERDGIAVGAYGLMLVTHDGGVHWDDRSAVIANPEGWHFNTIAGTREGVVLIAGEKGTLYRSSDGGESFINGQSPYEGSFFGTTMAADGSLYLFGLQGSLFRASAQAEQWTRLPTSLSSGLNDACTLTDGSVMITGNAGAIVVARDSQLRVERRADRQSVLSCIAVGDGVLLVGEGGVKAADATGVSR